MDRAQFELIGNVGKIELKSLKGGAKAAILSIATTERWKRDNGEWAERTSWHRVAVFSHAKVERVEAMVQKGTRLRLVGQIRPNSYDDETGRTRYVIEFIVGPFGDLEILARGKPRDEPQSDPEPSRSAKRAKAVAASDATV